MRITLNQTYEYLTCILDETQHGGRDIDDQLIKELFWYARILPMGGAVYAIDAIFLSPKYPIVVKAQKQLPKALSLFTVQQAKKQLYVTAVGNIQEKTLPEFITSDLALEAKLKQLQIFLIYSNIDRSPTEFETAKNMLADIQNKMYASPLDSLHSNCIRLLDER